MSFQALEIARSALVASRTALEVAGQNVANANTAGYVRQRISLAPVPSSDPGASVLVGGGVTVATIQRLRSQCLEAQINHQEGRLGQERSRAESLSRVENYFPDLTNSGLSAALEDLFGAFQRLQTTPASLAAREEVLFSADTLCSQFRETVSKLQEERNTLETDLRQQVGRANQLLHQVGELNAKIMSLGNNPSANDLRVTREQAIRELAGLCGASGLDQTNGAQDVLLGGVRLVQGSDVFELSLVPDPDDASRQVLAVGTVLDLEALAGTIAGNLDTREGCLNDWETHLNELAATVSEAVNAQHHAGYDLDHHSGGDFFTCTPGREASSLRVSDALSGDPRLLAASSVVGGAPGDGTNAAALAALRYEKLLSGGSETLLESHSRLIHAIGAETSRATDATQAREALLTSLQNQYDDSAGVSLDEEAVDVMRFQQMYTAAAKLVQMADQMMDQLFEMAG